jgi:aspartate aminotransferase
MPLSLSAKVASIRESQTLALAARAARMKEAGEDVVNLTAGEPDFPSPRSVKEAGIRAIAQNFTHYTANQGTSGLRQAIARKFASENNLHFDERDILVSTGAKQSIFNALQAICNPGDEVLLLRPYWLSYPAMVSLVDAVPVVAEPVAGGGLRPDPEAIRAAITPRTKALILNTPVNPSGVVFTANELVAIAGIVRHAGMYVISDEIYEKILFDGRTHLSIGSLPGMQEFVVTVNGVSKAFAMTGWRIGYMGGPAPVIEAAARIQSQVTSNANSVAQKAAQAALESPVPETSAMVAEFARRRDAALQRLAGVQRVRVVRPEGAFYILLDVRECVDNGAGIVDVAEYLLAHHRVAVVPGEPFGADGCIRLSCACAMDELMKGVDRVAAGLSALLSGV